MAGAPDSPLASAITVSFVDMSPSTVIVLKVSSVAAESAACSVTGAMAASVVTKQSIVAICGWIIPEPLAMATRRTVLPPSSSSRKASFVRRSVVRMASAAPATSSPSDASSAGTAAAIVSTGSRTPMAPVEDVRTSSARDAERRGDGARDGALVGGARRAGERVGVAAVGDDGADPSPASAAPRSGRARRTSG